MTVIEFILILAGLIIIHEFGHFLAMKAFGIGIEEFGIGIPPRIATMFHWRETAFTLNALPLGGFVRPKGDNDPSVEGGLAAAPAWKRIIVMLAGPTMNLVLAVILYSVIIGQSGIPDPAKSNVVLVSSVETGSPAEMAGLRVNDELVKIGDTEIQNSDDAHNAIYASLGKPVVIEVRRDGQLTNITVTPRANPTPDEGAIGILMDVPRISVGPFQALSMGAQATYMHSSALLSMVGRLVTGNLPDQGRLVGLKGMYDMYSNVRQMETRQVFPSSVGTLSFVIELTVSLGLLNLLPVPALDGGRVLFALPELLFRRRIPQQAENWVNAVGFLLLLALLIFINVQDFINPAIQSLPTLTPTP